MCQSVGKWWLKYVKCMFIWFLIYLVMCVCVFLTEGVPPGSMLVPVYFISCKKRYFYVPDTLLYVFLNRSFIYYD